MTREALLALADRLDSCSDYTEAGWTLGTPEVSKAMRDVSAALRALATPPADPYGDFVADVREAAEHAGWDGATNLRAWVIARLTATPPAGETPQGEAQADYDWRRFCVNHEGFSGPSHQCPACRRSRQAICSRCQMRLPQRLTTQALGPRGVDTLCAVCDPSLGPEKRAEVVALRRLRATPDRSEG